MKELAQNSGVCKLGGIQPEPPHFSPGPLQCFPNSSLDVYTCPLQSTPYRLVRGSFKSVKQIMSGPTVVSQTSYHGPYMAISLILPLITFPHWTYSHLEVFVPAVPSVQKSFSQFLYTIDSLSSPGFQLTRQILKEVFPTILFNWFTPLTHILPLFYNYMIIIDTYDYESNI